MWFLFCLHLNPLFLFGLPPENLVGARASRIIPIVNCLKIFWNTWNTHVSPTEKREWDRPRGSETGIFEDRDAPKQEWLAHWDGIALALNKVTSRRRAGSLDCPRKTWARLEKGITRRFVSTMIISGSISQIRSAGWRKRNEKFWANGPCESLAKLMGKRGAFRK